MTGRNATPKTVLDGNERRKQKGNVMSEAKESELLAEAEDLLREVWVQYRMERRVKGVMHGYSAGSMQTMIRNRG